MRSKTLLALVVVIVGIVLTRVKTESGFCLRGSSNCTGYPGRPTRHHLAILGGSFEVLICCYKKVPFTNKEEYRMRFQIPNGTRCIGVFEVDNNKVVTDTGIFTCNPNNY